MKLLISALSKYILGILIVGALLFIPAGSLGYRNAWLFMGLLFIPMFFLGVVLYFKAPELLAKRLNNREKEMEQKQVVALTGIIFIIGFIVAPLDFRFRWSTVPDWLVIMASIILVLSYGMYAEVMRENAYLSRTVEIQENQKVIDTGLYGIIRHPMYTATIFLYLAIPLVLGSLYAFIIFLIYPLLIAKRIKNEEELLEKGLEGYVEYKQRVKYRLIPFIW